MRRRRRDSGPGPDLRVELGPLRLQSPLVTASGTYGLADEYLRGADRRLVGAFTTKSLSVYEWEGNPPPRIVRTPAGMVNSIGLQNPGVRAWIESCLPRVEACGIPVIASVWGRRPEEFAEAARLLAEKDGIVAVELNLSCPNVESPGEIFAHSKTAAAQATAACAEAVRDLGKPIFAKLSPNLPSLVEVARSVTAVGATGLTLTNTLLAAAIDTARAAPALGNVTGGLSGPAIKPVVLRHVLEVATALPEVPIIATGGVFNGCDAAEMLMAGAIAVGVGTANFYDPRAPEAIARELAEWCRRSGFGAVRDVRGLASARRDPSPIQSDGGGAHA